MFGRRKRHGDEDRSPGDVYSGLRSLALEAGKSGVIPRHEDHPDVYGVVVDISSQGGFASVVALGDKTTSMYTSTGGGIIGAGERAAVAAAAHHLLVVVQGHLASFSLEDDGSLPSQGEVRFHLLGDASLHRADVSEDAFWGKTTDPLTPVIAAVQDVVSTMRQTTPS